MHRSLGCMQSRFPLPLHLPVAEDAPSLSAWQQGMGIPEVRPFFFFFLSLCVCKAPAVSVLVIFNHHGNACSDVVYRMELIACVFRRNHCHCSTNTIYTHNSCKSSEGQLLLTVLTPWMSLHRQCSKIALAELILANAQLYSCIDRSAVLGPSFIAFLVLLQCLILLEMHSQRAGSL